MSRSDRLGIDDYYRLHLDEYVQYRDGYEKYVHTWGLRNLETYWGAARGYIEIDIDKTKNMSKGDVLSSDGWKEVPEEVVSSRALSKAASLDPQVSATINDGISRINRGEINQFDHYMEDNSGNKHHFVYKR